MSDTTDRTLVPIADWKWSDDFSWHRTMTCVNHQTLRFLSKNPWYRSIFAVNGDCDCSLRDLAVIVPAEFSTVRGDDELLAAVDAALETGESFVGLVTATFTVASDLPRVPWRQA